MLIIHQLSKHLNHQPVIQSVDFQVPEGCFFTLLGISGAGKTTLLKLIAGLEKPDQGQITYLGRNLTNLPAEKRRIPMIFQQPMLFPHLTVYQNIAFGLEMEGTGPTIIKEKVSALMKTLQIGELSDRLPGTLSGGQQQRVSMARALAPGNSLILMDEPFSSLDPSLRKEMGQLVKDLQCRMNLTVVFVTHDVMEALQLSDHILLLKEGRVVETGTPKKLYEEPQEFETAKFMEAGNLVQGRLEEGRFHCQLGVFPALRKPDGPAVGVFPENRIGLQVAEGEGQVEEIRYLGKNRRVRVSCRGVSLWVEETASLPLQKGQKVTLIFPDQVHLIKIENEY